MPDPSHQSAGFSPLNADDQAALEAVIEASFEAIGVPAGLSDRAGRVLGLMSLLDSPAPELASHRSLLVDVTMARVLRERSRAGAGAVAGKIAREQLGIQLTEADAEALGDLASHGTPSKAVSPERAAAASKLLGLIGADAGGPSAEDRERLVGSTLAKIQSELDRSIHRWKLPAEELRQGVRRRFSLADIGAIAAMVLIGGAVLAPVATSLRENTREQMCASNMQHAGLGMGLFGASHDGFLPHLPRSRAGAPVFEGTWWNVGKPGQSHAANLFTLVSGGYASVADLSCPGNPNALTALQQLPGVAMLDWGSSRQVSFSYQLFGLRPPRMGEIGSGVVLADRNPLVEAAKRGEELDAMTASENHGGRGQNVLTGDGAVWFLRGAPVLASGDSLWQPAGQRGMLTGREIPASPRDAFVAP
ncbi:MAG: hypothetical protein IBJ11_00135 [Phycisphaerales bacterium]|nr:hypothetical protein [Phycisphaerales bacterium]